MCFQRSNDCLIALLHDQHQGQYFLNWELRKVPLLCHPRYQFTKQIDAYRAQPIAKQKLANQVDEYLHVLFPDG